MSPDALSGLYGGVGTAFGVALSYLLTRRGQAADARHNALEARFGTQEEKLDKVESGLADVRSDVAGLSGLVSAFVPDRPMPPWRQR